MYPSKTNNDFLTQVDNVSELESRMPEAERQRYMKFGHKAFVPAFVNRQFVIYTPTHAGCTVLATARITQFGVCASSGMQAILKNDLNGEELVITHVPRKLFAYPIFVSIPPHLELKWDARICGGDLVRSLSFALLVKTKNKSTFCSHGNIYMEHRGAFCAQYPAAARAHFQPRSQVPPFETLCVRAPSLPATSSQIPAG